MNEIERLPRVMAWVGIAFALTVPAIVLVLLVTQPGEPVGMGVEVPRFVALAALTCLPALVAWLGLRYRRRALLGAACALGLVVGVISVPFGLLMWVSVIAWAQAASRVAATAASARPAHPAVLVSMTTVLALLAGLTLFIHQDPACWTYVEDADGDRVYERADVDDSYPSGFGFPSLVQTGSETMESTEVDAETGEPVDSDMPTSGHVCLSDRVTVPQGAISLLLSASTAGAAVRFGRPRSPAET